MNKKSYKNTFKKEAIVKDEYRPKPIKDWEEDDRPREKLMKYDAKALSNAELLAILINTGTKSHGKIYNAVEIARLILNACDNNLNTLAARSYSYFMTFPGIGEAKAITIKAALELYSRKLAENNKVVQICSSSDVYSRLHHEMANLDHEIAIVIYLDSANKIIRLHKIGDGSIDKTLVDKRKFLGEALNLQATGIIIVHNHPSGNLQPSLADDKLTSDIKKACELLDLRLLDHLIFDREANNYYSYADNGKM